MKIVDITTKEEVSVPDTLNMSRYESLSATDYHLGVLPAIRISKRTLTQRGALEAIGGGIEAIGGGIWDATMYPARLFSSNASVQSESSPGSSKVPSDANIATSPKAAHINDTGPPSILHHGMKIFIQSPYDCVVATKPTLSDHFTWLVDHSMFEEAWNLLDRKPEVVNSQSDVAADSPSSTPNKGSLVDFFADDSSLTAVSKGNNSQAEKEKRRIGQRWLQQLISSEDWSKAGKVAGRVLGTSSDWEHWVWVFAQANKYDEITSFIPTNQVHPPLPSVVYELLLGHYVSKDRPRFQELLERWSSDLFDAQTIIEAVESKFRSGEVNESTIENDEVGRDWRILTKSLAQLYLAVGRPRKALSCYIRLQDADAAMAIIADAHLVDAVADDIPGFILLRVSREQQRSAPLSELATLTLEPIQLLVSEAHHGIVLPETVVDQLQSRYGTPNPYLFFYFRALWNGDTAPSDIKASRRTNPAEERLSALEGKTLVSDYADTAVTLFAEYDRALLMTFLKSSQSYTLEFASRTCEQRTYIPELVYLLSKEGRTAQALRLIIDSLGDVSQAIAFAREQNDASLWDDLLDYSMNKPTFIRGLLEEVGTSLDPLKLVKRIPTGLEIEGLREGLSRMLKEYEVQESISKGVARVLRGEVNGAMLERGRGMRKGIRFEIGKAKSQHREKKPSHSQVQMKDIKAGHCASCGDAINQQGSSDHASLPKCKELTFYIEHLPQYLLAFPCTHTFHLSCLLSHALPPDTDPPPMLAQFTDPSHDDPEDLAVMRLDKSIAPKVDRARLLRTVLGDGCPLEERERAGDG